MQSLFKIAIVGSGTSAFGALNGLALNSFDAFKVDHYVPYYSPVVHFDSGTFKVKLPSSTPYGALSLWGGILGFSSLKEYQDFSLWPLLNYKVQDPVGPVSDKILRSCDPSDVLSTFKLLIENFQRETNYALIKKGVSRIEKTNLGLQLFDLNGHKMADGYDAVILCAGAVQTPRILAFSGYLDFKIKLYDNSMKIVSNPEVADLTRVYDYSSKEAQYVQSSLKAGLSSHQVLVKKHYRFNCSNVFAKAYWNASGKSILHKSLVGLRVISPSIMNRKISISPALLNNIFSIHSAAAAKIQLEIGRKTTKITRDSCDPTSVSAFHLHGSIDGKKEAELLKENIFVADASVIRDINGLNPFAKIFSKATLTASKVGT